MYNLHVSKMSQSEVYAELRFGMDLLKEDTLVNHWLLHLSSLINSQANNLLTYTCYASWSRIGRPSAFYIQHCLGQSFPVVSSCKQSQEYQVHLKNIPSRFCFKASLFTLLFLMLLHKKNC